MIVKNYVLTYFNSRKTLPGDNEEDWLACEYLEEEIVDSMGIVEMIGELECTFKIRFSAEDMQSDEFRTVGGLIGLIECLSSEHASR